MQIDPSFWLNRRVLVTGHTGFKGIWLGAWLSELGADVVGFALPPTHTAALYRLAGIDRRVDSVTGDVRDRDLLIEVVRRHQPEIIFHLAAQPLVLPGLKDPVLTFETNVMGTLNLLEAARHARGLDALVVVTSDKVYAPGDAARVEDDPLGGHDPYAASKAAAELVVQTYARHYLSPQDGVGVATARAGNAIGGGDFGPRRLMPDLVRAGFEGRVARVRHPGAIRPWQHVLDALGGYVLLAQNLADDPARFGGAWNFGPTGDGWSVGEVADTVMRWLGGRWTEVPEPWGAEAPVLRLSPARAVRELGWRPVLDTARALEWTVEDYRELMRGEPADWLFRRLDAFAGGGGDAPKRRTVLEDLGHALGDEGLGHALG